MPDGIQNNRQHNREQQIARGKGPKAGFEYAVQPDGTSFGERRWRELRRRPHTCFHLHRPDGAGPRRTLVDVQRRVQRSSQQYHQQRNVPEPPPSEPTAPSQQQQPPPAAAVVLEQSSTAASLPPHSTSSPPHRIRNRHNAVYGQHLPNALNSPGLSDRVFGKQAAATEERSRCHDLFSPPSSQPVRTVTNDDVEDDAYDAFLANLDVDQLVSQREESTGGNDSYKNNNNSFNGSFDYGSQWGNDEPRQRGSSSSSFGGNQSFDSISPRGGAFDHGSSPFGGAGLNNSRNNNDGNTWGAANSSFQSASAVLHNANADPDAPLCPGHSLPCQKFTSQRETSSGRQFYKCSLPDPDKCDFFAWADGLEINTNSVYDTGGGYSSGEVKDIVKESRYKFGHRDFRPGQKEIVENAIAGRDVFVLMPTGGGKSLCYQLPAWCCPGLSVVVSPLLSLIQDQVQSMTKLGVESVSLSSTQDFDTEQRDIMRRLNQMTAHGGIKLLYITPEKLGSSTMTQSILRQLYNKSLISRFVIDEAHCVSDWGHDFRCDYQRLGNLRKEFAGVPLMALTATANEKVVDDTVRNLRMRNPYRYVSSFNRPNLRYEVRKKEGNKTVDEIADFIAGRAQDSGVIYCLSKKDCEKLAEKLQEKVRSKPGCSRVRISFYHAEVPTDEKVKRHREWSNGFISVLCATIAFGMGIDKPDVRYVIHYSMPKSITHYYQESGRAGRDRETADCILYYSYKDKKILENMILKTSNDPYGAATRRKIDQLYSCMLYCEDEFRCRRTMQLEFFGETFDRSKCNMTCDNCKAKREPDRRDLTGVAQAVLQLLSDVSRQRRGAGVTLSTLIDLFRGSKSQSATKWLDTSKLHGYGAGSMYKKYEVDRIIHAMIFERMLTETNEQNRSGFTTDYMHPGENAPAVQSGRHQFFVDFPKANVKPAGKENKKSGTKAAKKKRTTKATGSKNNAKATAKATKQTVLTEKMPPVVNLDDSDSDEEEFDASSVPRSSGSKTPAPSVLPQEATQELANRIKTLATNWAEEERMYGKTVFYWNILSNEAMKTVASQVPMTIEELKSIGGLGENIVKEYGDRIVKIVTSFVAQKGYGSYLEQRPALKRAKVLASSSGEPEVIELQDDEFDTDIDFASIPLPDDAKPAAVPDPSKKKSHYFG